MWLLVSFAFSERREEKRIGVEDQAGVMVCR